MEVRLQPSSGWNRTPVPLEKSGYVAASVRNARVYTGIVVFSLYLYSMRIVMSVNNNGL